MNILARLDLFWLVWQVSVMVQPALRIAQVLGKTSLRILLRRGVDLLRRIDPFFPAARFYIRAETQERFVQRLIGQARHEVGGIALFLFLLGTEQFLEKRRVDLRAAKI